MGARGPVGLSIRALTVRGSSLTARRRKAERRTTGKGDRLVCPDWLGAEEKDVWRRVVTALEPFGHLRSADTNALARYCQTAVLHRRLVVARDAAQDTNDPACIRLERRALKMSAALLALEERFGMTPASRARLGLPLQAPAESDGSRLFRLLPARGETS